MTEAPEARSGPPQGALTRALLALVAYALFRWTLEVARLPLGSPESLLLLAFAITAAGSIALPIAAIAALVRVSRRASAAVLVALLGLALWLGLQFAGAALPRAVWPLAAALQDLGKILAAAGVGVALASAIREPNILVPAGLFAAFADFVVVNFGTVKHALSSPKGQALLNAVSARVPSVHPKLGAGLTIGPADFLFLGIFLACAARFEMGLARNAVVLAVVLAVSLILVGVIGPVPALAPMSLAFVAANWRQFRLTRQELGISLGVLVVMGGLFLVYFLLLYPGKR